MNNWHNFLLDQREELVYNCPECYGRSQTCPCRSKYAEFSALHAAGIPFSMRKYARNTLAEMDSSDPTVIKMKEAWTTVYDNIEKVRESGINLYVYGDSGAGKTMCAGILVREAIKYGMVSQYVTLPSLVSIALNDDARKDALQRVDFLIIDDIKRPTEILSEKATQLYASILDQFFTARFESELPTILLSDAPLDEIINAYGLQRIKSSLTSKRTKKILHVGKDYRKTGEIDVG